MCSIAAPPVGKLHKNIININACQRLTESEVRENARINSWTRATTGSLKIKNRVATYPEIYTKNSSVPIYINFLLNIQFYKIPCFSSWEKNHNKVLLHTQNQRSDRLFLKTVKSLLAKCINLSKTESGNVSWIFFLLVKI